MDDVNTGGCWRTVAGEKCLHEDNLPFRNHPMKCGRVSEVFTRLTDSLLKEKNEELVDPSIGGCHVAGP